MPRCPCQISPILKILTAPVAYADCCQPYHEAIDEAKGVQADNAERLMRTRYSAFVLIKADYIVKTTVPAQQALLDIKAIESWARETNWAGLEIVAHAPKLGKRHAQVEFKAFYTAQDGQQAAHHELSSFVKVEDKWYFLDPTVNRTIRQKQPCLCGSGATFKRCCGGYLA